MTRTPAKTRLNVRGTIMIAGALAAFQGCEVKSTPVTPAAHPVSASSSAPEAPSGEAGAAPQAYTAIPASFPKDIPVYPGAAYRRANTQGENANHSQFIVPMGDFDEVEAFYRKAFADGGWDAKLDNRDKNGNVLLQYRKERRVCMLMLSKTGEGDTTIGVILSELPPRK